MIAIFAALALLAPTAHAQGAPPTDPAAAPKSAPAAQGDKAPQVKPPAIQLEKTPVGEFYVLNFDENADPQAMTLEGFVKICQDATRLNFTYATETQKVLSTTTLRMFGPKRIPKAQFFQFFQIMMIINDFVCTKVGPDDLAVWLIQGIQGNNANRQSVRNGAQYVKPEDLDRFADQPAVLITTVLDLPHTDVRTLSNSMRTMFVDANTQQIIPVGNSNSLIITGFGSNVAAIVRMLKFVDEASSNNTTVTPEFEVVPLEFASADEIADLVTELLDASRRATTARTGAVAAANGATAPIQGGSTESKILVDPRTNSLLVMAMPEEMPRIKELVARLDVDIVQGERSYHIYNLDNVDADELAKTLESFIKDASRITPTGGAATGGGARPGGGGATSGASSAQRNEIVVVPDKATNSLLIAANKSRYEEMLELIKRLDQRPDQVLIETALVELTGQDSFNLTVELGLADISGTGGLGNFGVSNFGLATFQDLTGPNGTPDGIPDTKVPAINTGVTAGIIHGRDFSLPVLLSALKTRVDTNVLNVPSVLVNNNKSAKVTSKDQEPTTTITATGGLQGQTQQNFKEYVDAGITMEISPSISASHYLRLNCSLEVSNFVGAVTLGAIPPPKTTRTILTTVNVPDGDTMVIGGIITDNKSRSRMSVPWLGDIPIIGFLFGSNSTSANKTTLYFFVTPHIMRDRDFADLAEYSYKRKLDAADTIGTDRIRVIDPTFGREKPGVDMRGFEVPLYRGPERGEVRGAEVGLDPAHVSGLLRSAKNGNTATPDAPADSTTPAPKQEKQQ